MKIKPKVDLHYKQKPMYKCICGHRFSKEMLPKKAVRRGMQYYCPNCKADLLFED